MAIDRIPGVGPTNADIATAVAAPSAATIATAVAAPSAATIAATVAAPSAATIAAAVAAPSAATIAAAVAAPSSATIASAVAAAVPTIGAINTSVSTYATGKTMKRVTLTSGSSYTVPASVTVINVCTVGGGGGGHTIGVGLSGQSVWSTVATSGGASIAYAIGAGGAGSGGAGGTTSFTGATSASGAPAWSTGTASTLNYPTFFPNGGHMGTSGGYGVSGNGNGGSGFIIVEYWS